MITKTKALQSARVSMSRGYFTAPLGSEHAGEVSCVDCHVRVRFYRQYGAPGVRETLAAAQRRTLVEHLRLDCRAHNET